MTAAKNFWTETWRCSFLSLVGCVLCVFTIGPRLFAQDQAASILLAEDAPQPMSPAQSAAAMHLPDGFRVELVASEPLIQEPSCIAFDHRGRMFVCELHGYNIEGHIDVTELNKAGELDKEVRRIRWELEGGEIAQKAASQQYGVVKMLTDTNGDGVMDKSQIWANHLPPCYGIVAARDGIIVTCAPDIVFLADRDDDGVADHRETLLTGFKRRFMERGINNPRWGLDNWIYVGSSGDGGTITGKNLAEAVELGKSNFRIKADGSSIEPVSGQVRTFGLAINDVGDMFPSSGVEPAVFALPLPYRYLTRNPWVATPRTNYSAADYNQGFRISDPHPWRVRRQQDAQWVKFYGEKETNSNYFSGGCSNEFYSDTLFPEPFRGNLFYCEPSLNIVHRCIVERRGAGYHARRAPSEQTSEFLASTDQWFRPVNLRVGPDGALYIVDMYREIVEDYSAIPRFLQQQYGLDQGADHGRIWRLVPDSQVGVAAARRAAADLSHHRDAELCRAIGDPSSWKRLAAQRLLIQRNATSVAELLSATIQVEETAHACIHAMYTLDAMGLLQAADVKRALQHNDYRVRLHALRLSESWLDSDASLLSRVLEASQDSDPSVRLQVAMTLGESDDRRAIEALQRMATQFGQQRWMATAILSSVANRADVLLAGLLKQQELGVKSRSLLKPLAETIARSRNASAISRMLTLINTVDDEIKIACLAGIVEGVSGGNRPVLESRDGFAGLSKLLQSDSQMVRSLATKLSAALPMSNMDRLSILFDRAAKEVHDENLSLDLRHRAVEVLASAPFDQLASAVGPILDGREPPSLQMAAIRSLGSSDDPRVADALLRNWISYTPAVRESVMATVFARDNRLPVLLRSIENRLIQSGDLNDIRREQLVNHRDPNVASRAKTLLVSSTASAELQQRISLYRGALAGSRNVQHGKEVFVKNCLPCHKLGQEGHDIGPPLGTIINRPDEVVLLDLLAPSDRIEAEYRSYLVLTLDGRSFSGLLRSESATSITLVKEKGTGESILRRDIDVLKASAVSLMPSNLHETISPSDAADLIGFMRQAFRNTNVKD